ncbi:predicted protein [Histoplasma mississippiense (nom. inval.)]|uniref:predicted protein n=1 Tax=Ajellomyces capsulatus (strain NAm1 / WU24) TaxID=2059318 RepID=UPI000157C65F|nr:predicted protein [Histoplasma mississippiense (nom. inval.)]EDN08342.1 predicted protein [Histoplasma mississippiense (nom. inval.)]
MDANEMDNLKGAKFPDTLTGSQLSPSFLSATLNWVGGMDDGVQGHVAWLYCSIVAL